jgi:hypothetical protein
MKFYIVYTAPSKKAFFFETLSEPYENRGQTCILVRDVMNGKLDEFTLSNLIGCDTFTEKELFIRVANQFSK